MQTNIGLFLAKRAELSPNLEAFVGPETGQRLTYEEMNARCNQTANTLVSAGIRPGDRVAILLMNGAEYLETFFAIAKIGAIAVPLNWRLIADELGFILKDSGAKTLVFAEEFAGVFRYIMLPLARPGLVTVAIFNFLGLWNEYIFALVFVNSEAKKTLPLGLAGVSIQAQYKTDFGLMFAGLVIVMIPTLIVYLILQRQLTKGITMGALKG